MRCCARLVAALACWVWAIPAPAAPNSVDVARAQKLTDEATKAFRDGRHVEAADKYEAAYALVANPILLKNAVKVVALHTNDCARVHRMADAYLATGPSQVRARGVAAYKVNCHLQTADAYVEKKQFGAGRAELERAQGLDVAPIVVGRVRSALKRLEAAEKADANVRVRVRFLGPDGAALTVSPSLRLDGRAVALDARSQLSAAPGTHTLEATAPGYLRVRYSFAARPDAEVKVTLVPVAVTVTDSSDADSGNATRVTGYVALAVAAAALAGAVVVDVGGQTSADEAHSLGNAGEDRDRYDALLDEVESAQLWSTVLYGGALAAGLAGGALLYFAAASPDAEGAQVRVGPAGAAVTFRW